MADDERPVGPVIVRRRLGTELRRLREAADLRLEAVAAELEVSPSKISRIETGHSTAKTWDVRNLLTLYGVTDEQRRETILGWAADAKAQAWWQPYLRDGPYQVDFYISLEAEASAVDSYCTPVLHGLLQTRAYAHAHLVALFPELNEAEIDGLVDVRIGRQRVLSRGDQPLRFSAIVDEAALRRQVGSPTVMAEQLDALQRLPENVELRVLPLASGPHRAITSPFTIFTPRVSELDPVVVAVEASMSDSYLERTEDVSPYQAAFREILASSLESAASLDLIRSLPEQNQRGTRL